MAEEETIDIEALLAPIAGENPAGVDLRWERIFDEIKAARRGGEEKEPEFAKIIELATTALANRSKDLQLAAYLTEALVQTRGFAGLRDGFRLLTALLEEYWEIVYPLPDADAPDGDEMERRSAPLFFVTEADRAALLPNRLSLAPLIPSNNGVVHSLDSYKSREVPPMREGEDETVYQQRFAVAQARAQEFDEALAKASPEVLGRAADDLAACLEALARFESVANDRLGRDHAPGTSALRKPVEECKQLLERAIKAREPESASEDIPSEFDGGEAQTRKTVGGPIRTREEALKRLAEVAAYFRRAEPHSPVSFLVERAASWGHLPFERLLPELVKDSSAREQIIELLGLARRGDDGDN